MYQWLQNNGSLIRIVSVFLLFMAAATWLPPELPQPLVANEPAVKLTLPLLRLPALQVNLLFSENPSLQKDALTITKKDLVKYLRPDSEATDWEVQVIKMHLGDPLRNWVVVALSLPQEEGILCILVPQDKQYTLFYTHEHLSPILSIQNYLQASESNTEEKEWLLVTEALEDYTGELRSSLWHWQEDKLQSISLSLQQAQPAQ